MPRTDPLPDWSGEDVYLIGGGRSLRGFDFDQLKNQNVIGCNQSFALGNEIVDICIFGDFKFWALFVNLLEAFPGWVVTPRHTMSQQSSWLKIFEREFDGLHTDKLGWNANTGAAAINLALILGARRVFLLGYDCNMDQANSARPDSSHWHDHRIEVPTMEHYGRFLEGFRRVAATLPVVFPGRQIFNISNGSSRVDCFPVVGFEEVGFRERSLEYVG